jgi:murein DD-endopeptidase MepM/ murein hydrolase activator NlpD
MKLRAPVSPAFVTSPFGKRVDPFTRRPGSFHPGIDFRAPLGAPVCAAAAGTVLRSYVSHPKPPLKSYGECLWIEHEGGVVSIYAHLARRLVFAHEQVAAGQLIAHAGSTGDSTGPHLHFEVRSRGTPIDPAPLFEAEDPSNA